MSNADNFVMNRMKELLAERGWTTYRLAKESGMPYSSLNNLFVRDTIPSVSTLEKICEGFQITLSQFFDREQPTVASFDMLSADERTVINLYRRLNGREKELLTAFLHGLSKTLPEEAGE